MAKLWATPTTESLATQFLKGGHKFGLGSYPLSILVDGLLACGNFYFSQTAWLMAERVAPLRRTPDINIVLVTSAMYDFSHGPYCFLSV